MFSMESNVNDFINYLHETEKRLTDIQKINSFAIQPLMESSLSYFETETNPDGIDWLTSWKAPDNYYYKGWKHKTETPLKETFALRDDTQKKSNYVSNNDSLEVFTTVKSDPRQSKTGKTYLYGPVHQFGLSIDVHGTLFNIHQREFTGMNNAAWSNFSTATMNYLFNR